MEFVDKIRDALTGESVYEYNCRNCGDYFESPHSQVIDVSCHNCGSANVTRV
jgi:Zn finger protein HypA/HybF involved in hydrogenase expression